MIENVLILGASSNPERYAHKACRALLQHNHQVYALGLGEGDAGGVPIKKTWPANNSFDTVTLYLHPAKQKTYYKSLLELKPRRVIFNPGTENPELQQLLDQARIPWEEACTLVLLSTGTF
ncbi:MAG: CoA-binding protein [Bacteroidota bacterium]|jgi:predicted CoA-binding protein